jgi:type II secretion system protein J
MKTAPHSNPPASASPAGWKVFGNASGTGGRDAARRRPVGAARRPCRFIFTHHRRLAVLAPAFTLIELLLAISIMSMVLAAMSGVLYLAFRLQGSVNDTLDQCMPVEQALTSIQRDLANIVCNNSSNNIMLIGAFQSVNQTNTLPGQVGPDFYTTDGQPDGLVPWGDVEKIDYLLVPAGNRQLRGNDLVCAVTRNLLPVNGGPTVPDRKTVLLSGVQNVSFMYYDGLAWDQSWDSTQQTNLPYGIRMDIRMASQGNGRAATAPKTYSLFIPVDVQMSTNLSTALP